MRRHGKLDERRPTYREDRPPSADWPPAWAELERRARTTTSCPVRFVPSCGACRYWLPSEVTSAPTLSRQIDTDTWTLLDQEMSTRSPGRCRRHAPTTDVDVIGGYGSGFPEVGPDMWCGDFEARGVL